MPGPFSDIWWEPKGVWLFWLRMEAYPPSVSGHLLFPFYGSWVWQCYIHILVAQGFFFERDWQISNYAPGTHFRTPSVPWSTCVQTPFGECSRSLCNFQMLWAYVPKYCCLILPHITGSYSLNPWCPKSLPVPKTHLENGHSLTSVILTLSKACVPKYYWLILLHITDSYS